MISHEEAEELTQLLTGGPLPEADLERALEIARKLTADTEPHPADKYSYAPCVFGKIEIGDMTSEFMVPLLNPSVSWQQWGGGREVLGPRVDLIEAMAAAAQEWAQENLCRTCGENTLDDGEGYDGECGDCADKTESARGTIYAYIDTVEEPIPADRWMWQTGNNWMAVAPGESEDEWFRDMDDPECPTPRVRPIDDIPTSGTLTYMRHDFSEVVRPADGEKEDGDES